MATQTRVRAKPKIESENEQTSSKKKRAPRKIKYGAKIKDGKHEGNLEGPLKASDKVIAEASKRKSTPGDPVPEEFWLSEEDKAAVVIKYLEKVRNPMTAIRAMCVLCMGGYLGEIGKCESSKKKVKKGDPWCPLHEFRTGDNPYHTRRSKEEIEAEGS